MTLDELVRSTLREMAQDSGPPSGDLAGRVIAARARRRNRTVLGAALAATAVVATAIVVPAVTVDGERHREAGIPSTQDVVAHPDQTPPRELIAAGRTAVAAWYTTKRSMEGIDQVERRTWHLFNTTTGRYEKTSWSWVAVAPGMRTAAVLEGELPTRRIGVVDMATGKVTRWIETEAPIAGLAWSPDGGTLVATAYSADPDRRFGEPERPQRDPSARHCRTGFILVDVASGRAGPLREAPQLLPRRGEAWPTALIPYPGRDDFRFSHDGSLIRHESPVLEKGSVEPGHHWYTREGTRTQGPEIERNLGWSEAGLSPDGRLAVGGADADGTPRGLRIDDSVTGEKVGSVPDLILLAWADNRRIFAWSCDPEECTGRSDDRSRLVLLEVGSDKTVPLSGYQRWLSADISRWNPLFATR